MKSENFQKIEFSIVNATQRGQFTPVLLT